MARPIKETPTLYGEDAIRFEQAIKNPQPVPRSQVMHAKSIYESVMRKAAFLL